MTTHAGAPFTFGQLSVLRDLDLMPAHRRHEANLLRCAPVDVGVGTDTLVAALTRLAEHHEGLRTTYVFPPDGEPRQRVHDPGALPVPVRVHAVSGPAARTDIDAEVAALAAAEEGRAFDLTVEAPWRAVVVEVDGRAARLVVVLHHIAVDLSALTLLDADFQALLRGAAPAPAPSPRALALTQRSPRWQARTREAWRHQREAFTTVARSASVEVVESPAAVVKAVLYSAPALRAAREQARESGVSVPSVVLAAYLSAAHDVAGADDVLVNATCDNRVHPDTARVMGSMNQWTPFHSGRAAAEPFDRFVQRTHWATVRAYRHGCFDPYESDRIRAEVARSVGTVGPEFTFNFIGAVGLAPESEVPDGTVRHLTPRRRTGPSFYLVSAADADRLMLSCQVMWQGFDADALERFLLRIPDLLRGA